MRRCNALAVSQPPFTAHSPFRLARLLPRSSRPFCCSCALLCPRICVSGSFQCVYPTQQAYSQPPGTQLGTNPFGSEPFIIARHYVFSSTGLMKSRTHLFTPPLPVYADSQSDRLPSIIRHHSSEDCSAFLISLVSIIKLSVTDQR